MMLDPNTLICQDEFEKGIPHYYADLESLEELFQGFEVESIKQIEYNKDFKVKDRREKFYYVNAKRKANP